MRKLCLLTVDVADGPILCSLALPAEATVAAALVQARQQLQDQGIHAEIDWDGAAVGVWGVRCERSAVPRDGDRIELYRPLSADPRQRRRLRARAARRS
jgi:uncharacterized protein